MKLKAFPAVLMIPVIMGLSGCLQLLGQDFDKATMVGDLRLGSPEKFKRTVALPSGNARLILAVPNYRCAPIDDAPIVVSARGPTGIEFSERLLLSQLTWSYGENSCDAFGFLEVKGGKSPSAPGSGEMRLDIKHDQEPVTIEVDASQVRTSSARSASVWLIYGDRVPSRKMFGEPSGKAKN